MRWQVLSQENPQSSSDIIKILAKNRNLSQPDALLEFISPPNPKDLSLAELNIDHQQLLKAFEILLKAKTNRLPVVICGDYDADGICATAIMWQALHTGGWQVKPFIPDRKKHGYGLSLASISDILAMDPKPEVVITVDNGIVAHQPTQTLVDQGVAVIVTDHHQPELELNNNSLMFPPADSVVHSTQLCGASVAWIFVKELCEFCRQELLGSAECDMMSQSVSQALELAGLATIADQVPLLAQNRSFAKHGLSALKKTTRPGLLALLESVQVDPDAIDETTVSFRLAPRINAMGRLEHGLDALRLLCTKKITQARELVSVLNQTNLRRQDVTFDQYQTAKAQALTQQEQHLLVVHGSDFHEGVIGLIAGRLVEEFDRPAIVISSDNNLNGVAKASARSLQGVNIVELIRQVRHDLLEVGGHPMAAGFSLESTRIEVVTQQLQSLALTTIKKEELQLTLTIESYLPTNLVTLESQDMIQTFSPFGQKNREPIWWLEFDQILSIKLIGSEQQHCKILFLDSKTGVVVSGLCWSMSEPLKKLVLDYNSQKIKKHRKISIAATLEINTWNQQTTVQLKILDLKMISA
jgi:single-stranded-DNA-specific exonuclease